MCTCGNGCYIHGLSLESGLFIWGGEGWGGGGGGGHGREEELGEGGGGWGWRNEIRKRLCAVGSLKEKSEKFFNCSCQDSNLWPLDHEFGCLTTELCSSHCGPCTTNLSLELCLRWCVAHNIFIYEVKKLLNFYCFSHIYCIGDQTSIFESPDYIWYWHRGLNYMQFIYIYMNYDPHFSFGAIVDDAWCMFLNSCYTCIHFCILRCLFSYFHLTQTSYIHVYKTNIDLTHV